MQSDDCFYIILREDDCKPMRHRDYQSALTEAQRLCQKEGKKMLILSTVSKAELSPRPVVLSAVEWPGITEDQL